MKNYKIIIQYDGTNFSGWQIQKKSTSIQQTITEAIEMILKEEINLIGSGRTDSGVHALGQTANFRTENEIDIYRFKHSLNSILPAEILISQMEEADTDFHARYDARKRTYLYLISQTRSPFYKNYSYFYPRKIDLQKLNMLSELFLGEKDFTSFSKKNDEIENKMCKVYKAFWYKKSELILFVIQADRYLHGMVRTITGTLLNAQDQPDSESFISKIFNSHNREEAFESVPAKGLFLYKVEY
ncbi:MAG: tRNA pseudouridine(38-40) synthase TruA [Ignavibacteriaceae bacterium]|nr:tRNA pseudouridine(38-40) synthase TruA [Ignavibacterium sp.]MCC6254422.1 tRNA pseudouridine(38-40) synthase TruA [Ignavibacteriaceae bacterium]HMN26213.1 tRNA pseudouridine(38-40) synthase TruA [Ignavibacteriaceae bacterium]HRN27297.1 tRNA pseudouridine(38-40) synthase TruA [Ignavibacteriaceae bacterium]HRP93336.1 tRNA pseudouridine(38-40) synthase TruA [Ignavibacteriaceae bacterium]